MVEYRTQGVIGVSPAGGFFDGLRNRQPQRTRIVRIQRQRGAARLGDPGRAGEDLRAPGLHHQPPVGLLPIADPDHVHPHRQAEHLSCERDGGTPLPGAGFRRQAPDASLAVVERLRHGGVGFVRAGRGNALVFEEEAGWSAQRLLQPGGAHERRGPPDLVDFTHRFRNRDPALGAHFLLKNCAGEDRAHLLRRGRVAVRPQRRRGRAGQVRCDVIPMGGHFVLFEQDAGGIRHGCENPGTSWRGGRMCRKAA